MDNKEHILDVSIAALQWEMWLKTRKPPMSTADLKNWLNKKTPAEMTEIFHRTPGVIDSMQDIDGDFWQELKARIDFRVEREKQDCEKIRKAALEHAPLPLWKKVLAIFGIKCRSRKKEK